MKMRILLCILVVLCPLVWGDTPANCTYEDARGEWIFSIGDTNGADGSKINCSKPFTAKKKLHVHLAFPDRAFDQFGNIGFWTLIYNQGFEVVIANRKYFFYFKYQGSGKSVVSICNQTIPAWTHDVLERQWGCASAIKSEEIAPRVEHVKQRHLSSIMYQPDVELIRKINSVQTSWRATHYPQFEGKSMEDLVKMAGGRGSRIHNRPRPAPVSRELAAAVASLPKEFDWRNMKGINYVSPVRNQGSCGSCYSFSSAGMLEARIRVRTNNTLQPVISPQDVVECSSYSQGCAGGFPYLIAGKYAEDFGMADETCNPYSGKDGTCKTKPNCKRYYATKYRYVGGFYGACNEELMKLELIHGGPLSVSFMVYDDFMHYKSGIYHHTGLKFARFNPFEITNHAVLLVGYGFDHSTGTKYWTVKNSWGPAWGEYGYFRILRGADECAIESLAVVTEPVL